MLAVEFIKVAIVGGMMLRAIPPVPVATFRDQKFLVGELTLGLGALRCGMVVGFAGVEKIIPGAIVFGSTDPDIEVGRDPGTGRDRIQAVEVAMARDRFGDGDGFHSGAVL